MKSMLKVLVFIGIVLGALISVKIGMELWSSKMKKYFSVDRT